MTKDFISFRNHVNPVLAQLLEITGMDARFVRASGCSLWDDQGEEYLDFFSGSGVFNLGHNHPAVIDIVMDTLKRCPPQVFGIAPSPFMGRLAEKLTAVAGAPFDLAFFSNSGSEAVEGALKIARACTRRPKIVYCENAYHGTTMGSLSLMESGPFRDPFEPLLADCVKIPFNDADALAGELRSPDCAAFILEPIQAEGGVNTPAPHFLELAAALCRNSGALLILDEVQTGLGRTGSMFAFQGEGLVPDIFVAAKALGGGIMPIGAYVTRRDIYQRAYGSYELCESHHSTFGGNSLACQAASVALDLLNSPELLRGVREKGEYFLGSLRETIGGSPHVKEIRGRGLLIGIEFAGLDHPQLQWENLGVPGFSRKNMAAQLIMKRLFKKHIVVQTCVHSWSTLKLEPPLTVEQEQIDRCVAAIGEAVTWLESIL